MSRATNGCCAPAGARSTCVKRWASRAIRSSSASASAIDQVLADAAEHLVVDLLVVGHREVQLDPHRHGERASVGRARWLREYRPLRGGALAARPPRCGRALAPAAVPRRALRSAVPGEAREREERQRLLLAHPRARLV